MIHYDEIAGKLYNFGKSIANQIFIKKLFN